MPSPYDKTLLQLQAASVPDLADLLLGYNFSDVAHRKYSLDRVLGMLNHVWCARLTTETGVAVSTSDRTSQSSVFLTPYCGNLVSLSDGSRYRLLRLTADVRLDLSSLTSGRNYDVFAYNSYGNNVALELSAAWNSDGVTRTDAIGLVDGVYVKSTATHKRYVGTIRATAATTTEDSAQNRLVWNAHNRVSRTVAYTLAHAAPWTYATPTWRSLNADSANRVAVVAGLKLEQLDISLVGVITYMGTNGAGNYLFGFGEDSTSTPLSNALGEDSIVTYIGISSIYDSSSLRVRHVVPQGYHFYQALEKSCDSFTVSVAATETTIGRHGGIVGEWGC